MKSVKKIVMTSLWFLLQRCPDYGGRYSFLIRNNSKGKVVKVCFCKPCLTKAKSYYSNVDRCATCCPTPD